MALVWRVSGDVGEGDVEGPGQSICLKDADTSDLRSVGELT